MKKELKILVKAVESWRAAKRAVRQFDNPCDAPWEDVGLAEDELDKALSAYKAVACPKCGGFDEIDCKMSDGSPGVKFCDETGYH